MKQNFYCSPKPLWNTTMKTANNYLFFLHTKQKNVPLINFTQKNIKYKFYIETHTLFFYL